MRTPTTMSRGVLRRLAAVPERIAPTTSAESLHDAKLSAPHPRPGAVSRTPLIDSARQSGCRVVGVTAPAGYGKSTLLAEWADGRGPAGRLGVARPLRRRPRGVGVGAGIGLRADLAGRRRSRGRCAGVGVSVLGRAAPRLASAFASSPNPFVLMLDDLHELRSPACHDALGVVISGLPPGLPTRRRQPFRAAAPAAPAGLG